jgi:hypothetical protein
MKNPIRFTITLAGAVLCALPNLAMAQSDPGNSQGDQGAAIEGTWIVTVDRLPASVKFSALQSFTAGGVVLAAGTLDRMPPPPASSQSSLYGSWTRTDDITYVATFNFFGFDVLGNAVYMFQNNATFHLTNNNNNLTGSGTACTWDVIGGIIQMPPAVPKGICHPVPGSITITGTRLIPQGA